MCDIYYVTTGEIGLEKEAAIITDNKSYPTSSKVDVVIVTPGRLTDHILRGSFSSLQYLRWCVCVCVCVRVCDVCVCVCVCVCV